MCIIKNYNLQFTITVTVTIIIICIFYFIFYFYLVLIIFYYFLSFLLLLLFLYRYYCRFCRLTGEYVLQQGGGEDEDADQDVGDGEVSEEVVGDGSHRRVVEHGGDDQAVVENSDDGDRSVGDRQQRHSVPRQPPRRPRLLAVVSDRFVVVAAVVRCQSRLHDVATVHFRQKTPDSDRCVKSTDRADVEDLRLADSNSGVQIVYLRRLR